MVEEGEGVEHGSYTQSVIPKSRRQADEGACAVQPKGKTIPKNGLWKILAASRTRRRYGAGCTIRQLTRRIRNVENYHHFLVSQAAASGCLSPVAARGCCDQLEADSPGFLGAKVV